MSQDTQKEIAQNMIEDKHYNWQGIENYIIKKNKEELYYANVASNKEGYSIIMPPPNVTGSLHMGHALVTTLQDVMVRHKRMQGYDVLWQPGVDHAGIATQVIVERQLAEQGLKRTDLGREAFLEKVYEWKDKSAGNIVGQIKRMGSSCDFSYLAFTMDDQSIKGVNSAFTKLYDAGLIYQDDRLVNWDCKLQTAISDLEVETKDIKGNYYYLKYYLVDSKDYLIVATTRPETLFGDSGVAVNPKDDRYQALIGKEIIVPIINRRVKIVGDDYADITKGSGAVKITPAHDFNDFEVGKRNNLEIINILNKNGTLNSVAPQDYQGLSVGEARKKIILDLEEKELIEKIEPSVISTPYGDRSGTVIEPLLTKQWFLDAETLAKDAIKAVEEKRIEFVPENWKNLYFDWMKNIKPWCISRQLWWGHRIPVYYGEDGNIFVAESLDKAMSQAKAHYGKEVTLRQDEDVLDTWFSSSLWPFLTLGWPEDTEKLKKYYPTNVLVTAFDIIFFWVARMIMMGLFFMKEVPFKKVYIHALIRDEKGQKMSKSKGNVIDPLDIIEKYGTDTLRFTLMAYSGQGRDIKLAEKTIEGYRNFVTKIWNSYKFCKQNNLVYDSNFDVNNVTLEVNQWILSKLQELQENVNNQYEQYKFNEVASSIYQFVWGYFCDWYIEFTKPILYADTETTLKVEVQKTIGFVFNEILKIIHPVMPFISDYLYEDLHKKGEHSSIILETDRKLVFNFNNESIINVDNIIEFISKIRKMRVDLNISPALMLQAYFQGDKLPSYILNNIEIIKKIARLESVVAVDILEKSYIQDVVAKDIFGISISGVINIEVELARLNKNKVKIQNDLDKILSKLNNKNFIEKAQNEVVESFKQQKLELEEKMHQIDEIISKIS